MFRISYLTKKENGAYDKCNTETAETLEQAKARAEEIVKGDVYVANIYDDNYLLSVRKSN